MRFRFERPARVQPHHQERKSWIRDWAHKEAGIHSAGHLHCSVTV